MLTHLAAFGLTIIGIGTTSLAGNPEHLQSILQADVANLGLQHSSDGRLTRVWGQPFSTGSSAKESAVRFLDTYAGIWGIEAGDLSAVGRYSNGRHLQPIMPERNAAGEMTGFKFTGVSFTQHVDGLPVWRTSLCLLVRNNEQHDLVLAAADLRDLGNFSPKPLTPSQASRAQASEFARNLLGPAAIVREDPFTVVFAGVGENSAPPTVAIVFEAQVGSALDLATYRKMLYVINPVDGTVLYEENRILNCVAQQVTQQAARATTAATFNGLAGSIQAIAGDAWNAEPCDGEQAQGLPYAEFTLNGQTRVTDQNGLFSITENVGDQVTLSSDLRGTFFFVDDLTNSSPPLDLVVSDGETVTIEHNQEQNEFTFSNVDTYISVNQMRSMILESNPEYPTISTETGFPIRTNVNDVCNAFYDYSSINFFNAGGGCNNTGFPSVACHEYGHHAVACAGSGQGEYGEGHSDAFAMVMTPTFDPQLGRGFFANNCGSGIRNADNDCQYQSSGCSSCGSAIHSCGQLHSGCIYDLWQAVSISSPLIANQLIRDLVVNSTLLHTGTSIDSTIAIDMATLDDDDGDLANGSPHYDEITQAYGAHNMPPPQLAYLNMSLVGGPPSWINASGGDELRLQITDSLSTFLPGSARVFVGVQNTFDVLPLTDAGNNEYAALLPPIECGLPVSFLFTARTVDGILQRFPEGAPANQFETVSATAPPVIAFSDDCSTDPGWTVSGDASQGTFERGIPAGGNNRPQSDCDDATSFCWITGNTAQGGGDVDGGETIITSPLIDATGVEAISYCFWYRNSGGGQNVQDDVFLVQVSDDNAQSWTTIQTVGPTGPNTSGEWATVEIPFSAVPGFEPNNQFRVRFNASDLNENSRVEAAVDNIVMVAIPCSPEEPSCPGDVTGDGLADVNDVLGLLSVWGTDDENADLDNSGSVEVNDLLLLLGVFGDC